jgi:hypothetical protein
MPEYCILLESPVGDTNSLPFDKKEKDEASQRQSRCAIHRHNGASHIEFSLYPRREDMSDARRSLKCAQNPFDQMSFELQISN